MPEERHIDIILDAIDTLQGENVAGAGTLETLKDLMPTVEECEGLEKPPPGAAAAVISQSETIASLFQNGFTVAGLASATTVLQNKVDDYLNP